MSEQFYCTQATLGATLALHGVAIIPRVLSPTEITEMQEGAWKTIEHLGKHLSVPIKQNDPASWRSYSELFPAHNMLVQHWEVGHAQFIWNLRQNPKVVDTFATLWGCRREDLLTSMDAMSFHFPPETTQRGFFRQSWLHTDQSPLDSSFKCVQSWITAYDVGVSDATLSVLVGSHLHHQRLKDAIDLTAKTPGKNGQSDWYKITADQHKEFVETHGCKEHHITCPAGSMVFWDSRTLHCGRESLKGRTGTNFRCVVYICMLPRSAVEPPKRVAKGTTPEQAKGTALTKLLVRRKKAFKERRMTTHWPTKCTLFGKVPQTYGKPLPKVDRLPDPTLTALGRSLLEGEGGVEGGNAPL
jgi:hypothetical protein